MAEGKGKEITGKVVSVQGPVVDVKFAAEENLPNVYDMIRTETGSGEPVVLEVVKKLRP